MNSETAEEIDLGLQVADGEQLKLSYEGDSLACSFLDWREQKTEFTCLGVLSFRWQPLEYHFPHERPDCTYEILNSRWIASHHEQGQIGSRQAVRHFRLNFNAIGCLEVICTEIKKK